MPQFVEELHSILVSRGCNISRILIGHPLGSIVAMHYASQYQKVHALVLIGAGRPASHIASAIESMRGLASKARESIEGIRDSTVTNNVAIGSSDLVRTVARQMISSQNAAGYAATCEAHSGFVGI